MRRQEQATGPDSGLPPPPEKMDMDTYIRTIHRTLRDWAKVNHPIWHKMMKDCSKNPGMFWGRIKRDYKGNVLELLCDTMPQSTRERIFGKNYPPKFLPPCSTKIIKSNRRDWAAQQDPFLRAIKTISHWNEGDLPSADLGIRQGIAWICSNLNNGTTRCELDRRVGLLLWLSQFINEVYSWIGGSTGDLVTQTAAYNFCLINCGLLVFEQPQSTLLISLTAQCSILIDLLKQEKWRPEEACARLVYPSRLWVRNGDGLLLRPTGWWTPDSQFVLGLVPYTRVWCGYNLLEADRKRREYDRDRSKLLAAEDRERLIALAKKDRWSHDGEMIDRFSGGPTTGGDHIMPDFDDLPAYGFDINAAISLEYMQRRNEIDIAAALDNYETFTTCDIIVNCVYGISLNGKRMFVAEADTSLGRVCYEGIILPASRKIFPESSKGLMEDKLKSVIYNTDQKVKITRS